MSKENRDIDWKEYRSLLRNTAFLIGQFCGADSDYYKDKQCMSKLQKQTLAQIEELVCRELRLEMMTETFLHLRQAEVENERNSKARKPKK